MASVDSDGNLSFKFGVFFTEKWLDFLNIGIYIIVNKTITSPLGEI